MNIIYIRLAAAAALVIVLGGMLWRMDTLKSQRNLARTELAQAKSDLKKCQDDKKLTEEAGRDLENRYGDVANQLDELKRLRPAKCFPVPAKPTSKPYEGTSGGQSSDGNGLRSEWLYDFAGQCEKDRQQVLSLQNFINKVWDSR